MNEWISIQINVCLVYEILHKIKWTFDEMFIDDLLRECKAQFSCNV